MDPRTGIFHPEDDDHPLPSFWPRFTVGEIVVVKGTSFTIDRINGRLLILRSIAPGDSDDAMRDAHRLMQEMQ